jgi:hypothetical protein
LIILITGFKSADNSQVLYGGWGPYSGPRVDDDSDGWGVVEEAKAVQIIRLLHPMRPAFFRIHQRGLTGPVHFIVCRVCEEQCCGRGLLANARAAFWDFDMLAHPCDGEKITKTTNIGQFNAMNNKSNWKSHRRW